MLATGGYGNVFFLSTNAMDCNVTAAWRAHRRGALFANPCYTQIHPTCIPQSDEFQSKLTLMSESLRNDGRVWVPKDVDDERPAGQIPEGERDYYLERLYPSFGNLAPRDIASRAAKRAVDSGRGVGPKKNGVYLDFADAVGRLGQPGRVRALREPLRDVRADHRRGPVRGADAHLPGLALHDGRAVGRLRADDHVPGLYAAGEANFSDHGANRLGASALMQGLADGYFVLPNTISNFLAPLLNKPIPGTDHPAFAAAESAVRARFDGYLAVGGTRSPDYFHRELGRIIWDYCGMERTARASRRRCPRSPRCTRSSRRTCASPAAARAINQTLEKAGRVDDFFELGMLMCRDAVGARGELRRALPGRVPDRGGRGAARRRAVRPRRGVGVDRRPGGRQAPPGGTGVRGRPLPDAELQVTTRWTGEDRSSGPRAQHHGQGVAAGRSHDRRAFETHHIDEISHDASFLELLDVLNERLVESGHDAITFEHDCREGICGSCALMINGQAHGPQRGTARASSTCASSPTAPRSSSSRGGPRPSRSSRT